MLMSVTRNPLVEPMIRRFSERDDVSDTDLALLRSVRIHGKAVRRGEEFIRAKSRPHESCLLLDGVAGRQHLKVDGRRQISSLHFAGDIVAADSFFLERIGHAAVALTDCRVGFIPHTELSRIIGASPQLAHMFSVIIAIDGASQRAWIANIGRNSALARTGHLICEIYRRMTTAGLAYNFQFACNLKQADLADCLGLSVVHLNRSLQELRSCGLVSWKRHEVVIHDWAGLLDLSDFEGAHLTNVKLPH